MMNNTPWSGAKKRRESIESIEAESRQMAKTFQIVTHDF